MLLANGMKSYSEGVTTHPARANCNIIVCNVHACQEPGYLCFCEEKACSHLKSLWSGQIFVLFEVFLQF